MNVRLTEGIRAGEVVDMPYHMARPLIDQGRVIDMRIDPPEAESVKPEVTPSVSAPINNSRHGTANQRSRR